MIMVQTFTKVAHVLSVSRVILAPCSSLQELKEQFFFLLGPSLMNIKPAHYDQKETLMIVIDSAKYSYVEKAAHIAETHGYSISFSGWIAKFSRVECAINSEASIHKMLLLEQSIWRPTKVINRVIESNSQSSLLKIGTSFFYKHSQLSLAEKQSLMQMLLKQDIKKVMQHVLNLKLLNMT
ncbi:hypothetical protein BDR06DRAFT_977951 [Suillus hirtellus]|nr:hypothetical protein BDR06DRAFT_977951 [Suillus hirtellus]